MTTRADIQGKVRRALPPYPPHGLCELAHTLRGYASIPNTRELAQIGAFGAMFARR